MFLGNNLLIKSNRGRDLKTDYNQFSDLWWDFYIKCRIGFRLWEYNLIFAEAVGNYLEDRGNLHQNLDGFTRTGEVSGGCLTVKN